MTEGEAKRQAREYEVSVFRTMLESQYGKVWSTSEMQEDYIVVGFSMGCVVVDRKSDGRRGSMDFTHMPRFYHSFQAA